MNSLESLKQLLLNAAAYLTGLQQQKNSQPSNVASQPVSSHLEAPVKPGAKLAPYTLLYNAAYSSLGKDLSKWAPNERGCAESASRVIKMVYPDFPVVESTITLNSELAKSTHFRTTDTPQPGTVSVFPTQGNTVGHCGIWGKSYVLNNNSNTGKFDANYNHAQWYTTARNRGLKLYFYDPL